MGWACARHANPCPALLPAAGGVANDGKICSMCRLCSVDEFYRWQRLFQPANVCSHRRPASSFENKDFLASLTGLPEAT